MGSDERRLRGSTSDSSVVVAVGPEASKDVGMPLSLNLPGKTEERRSECRVVKSGVVLKC